MRISVAIRLSDILTIIAAQFALLFEILAFVYSSMLCNRGVGELRLKSLLIFMARIIKLNINILLIKKFVWKFVFSLVI